jgi:hypothetical protein
MLKYMLIIIDSMVNMIGRDLYAHLKSMRIFTLKMNKNIHMGSKYYETNDLWARIRFVDHLELVSSP